jgi:hypothetical protein
MKKIIVAVTAVVFVFAFAGTQGWARTKKAKVTSAAAEKKKRNDLKKTREVLAQKRLDLENTQWDISLKLSSGEKTADDRLFFKKDKFSSRELELRGFKPTGYSLALQDDGVLVFETMQPSENGGTVFWRGEFGADNISVRGMVSRVFADQPSQDLYFSGSKAAQATE